MENMRVRIEGTLTTEEYSAWDIEDLFLDWCKESNIDFNGIIIVESDRDVE